MSTLTAPSLTIPDDAWCAYGAPNEPGGTTAYLGARVAINGVDFHVEAYQIAVVDGEQRALQFDDDLGAVHGAAGADGHFQTVEIDGRPYVLVLTPFC